MEKSRGSHWIVILFFMILLGSGGAHAENLRDTPTNPLAPFLEQFSRIHSVHVQAEAILQLETPAGTRTGRGSFSYWEQGDRFRVRCETDEALGLMDDVEWSYDGESSRLWFLESNTVTENTSLDRNTPTALPNPFFLPVEFLLDREGCADCRASLERVVQASGQWQGDFVQAGRALRLEEPGPSGEPSLLMEIVEEERRWVPAVILRILPGESRLEMKLQSYEPSEGFIFPRTISVRTWSPASSASLHMELLITQLEINQPLPEGAFASIGDDTSTFIFSGDEERDIPTPEE